MKQMFSLLNKNVRLRLLGNLLALSGLLFFCLPVTAQTLVTYAQFIERSGSQDFRLLNNTSTANFGTVAGGSPIYFRYQNITNLDPSLQGFQDAVLVMNSTTSTAASLNNGSLTQPVDNTVNSIQILRDTPAAVGINTRRNLLTVTFASSITDPKLVGTDGGNSATFSVSTPDQTVTFSSDFLNFSNTSQRNLALSFSSVNPGVVMGSGGFLQTFAAAGSGTFASNPPPTVVLGPTAATGYLGGRVTTVGGRGIANVVLTAAQQNGVILTARSNSFGYFLFPEVETGQMLILTAHSKRYAFEPVALDFVENLNDFVLTPTQY